jgi:hypothetical protein
LWSRSGRGGGRERREHGGLAVEAARNLQFAAGCAVGGVGFGYEEIAEALGWDDSATTISRG